MWSSKLVAPERLGETDGDGDDQCEHVGKAHEQGRLRQVERQQGPDRLVEMIREAEVAMKKAVEVEQILHRQ